MLQTSNACTCGTREGLQNCAVTTNLAVFFCENTALGGLLKKSSSACASQNYCEIPFLVCTNKLKQAVFQSESLHRKTL